MDASIIFFSRSQAINFLSLVTLHIPFQLLVSILDLNLYNFMFNATMENMNCNFTFFVPFLKKTKTMQLQVIFPSLVLMSALILSIMEFSDKSVRAQNERPLFVLPVKLFGFPFLMFATRSSNFAKKLRYSFNPGKCFVYKIINK